MGISVFPEATASTVGAQTFNSSGTWTAPTGVTKVTCTVVGGGGGGGAGGNGTANADFNFPTGGGAGGAVTTSSVLVTPGTTYTVVVGAGGNKGVSTGSDSSFVSASAGGYSSFAANYTFENLITNGAVELGSGDWLAGEQYNSSISSPPAYPNEYNGVPTRDVSNTNVTGGTNIPNVTGYFETNLTRYFTNNKGNSGYRDIILWVPVTQNTQYILSAYLSTGNSEFTQGAIRIDWYSGFNSGLLGNMQSSVVTLPNSPSAIRISVTGTSPFGANFALVRLMSSRSNPRFTGVLLQTGSTLNNYVGPGTSIANKLINGLGIISLNSGVINNGGGGGNGQKTNESVDAPGFGGGAAVNLSGTVIGGNGAGAGIPGVFSVIASANAIPYINFIKRPNNGAGGIPSGNPAISLNATNGGYIIQPNGNTGLDGYGAGGMGMIAGNSISGVPGTGVGNSVTGGNPGVSATPNTGAGGGGGGASTTPSIQGKSGGDGGSGIVILNW
jgi:hypothetical protein